MDNRWAAATGLTWRSATLLPSASWSPASHDVSCLTWILNLRSPTKKSPVERLLPDATCFSWTLRHFSVLISWDSSTCQRVECSQCSPIPVCHRDPGPWKVSTYFPSASYRKRPLYYSYVSRTNKAGRDGCWSSCEAGSYSKSSKANRRQDEGSFLSCASFGDHKEYVKQFQVGVPIGR